MSGSTTNLDTIAVSDSAKETKANALFDAGSPATLFGRRASTTSALTWGFYGGVLNVAGTPTQIANGTVALTGAATNYVEATTAGVVSANTSAFTGGRLPLYTVVCGASAVTSYTDHRSSATGAGITTGGAGTVTSVAASVPAFLSVAGSPITTSGTLAISYSGTALPVANGGTGATSLTAYAPVFGGTTGTGAVQSGTAGTAGQVLTSNGAGVLPTFQAAASSSPLTTKGDLYVYTTTNARLPVGATDGHVLTVDAAETSGMKWAAAAGGGLTNFTEAVTTAAPNATIPVVSLTATNAATNVDAVFKPKGTGGVAAAIADSTATGGDKRGSNAVDWQISRANANQVASGAYSAITGGQNNRAAANTSTVIGGSGNAATGTSATAGGSACTASGAISVAIGNTCTASSDAAVALGYNNTASGVGAFAVGRGTTASGTYSVATGYYSTTRGILGARAHASSTFVAGQDWQDMRVILGGQTTNATPKVLTADNGAAGTANQLTVASGSASTVKGLVVARSTTGDVKSWSFEASIKNNSGTTAMVAACTPVVVAEDAGATAWALTVTADNTNDAIALTFTGAAATTIRTAATLTAIEIKA